MTPALPLDTRHLLCPALRQVMALGLGAPMGLLRLAYLFGMRHFSLQEIIDLNLACGSYHIGDFRSMMSKEETVREQRRLAPKEATALTEDKAAFADHARVHGLPVPLELARITPDGAILSEEDRSSGLAGWIAFLRRYHGCEIVVKNSLGAYGTGVALYRVTGGNLVAHNDSPITASECFDAIRSSQGNATYLVQERLFSHDAIGALSGSRALQTLRMITCVDRAGHVHIPLRKLRLAGVDEITDNFRAGIRSGALCRLDERGQIDQVLARDSARKSVVEVDRLPGVDSCIKGFQVPYWTEATTLMRRAATAFQPLPCIGWDVAITNDGPVLIEGNIFWDPLTPLQGSMRQVWDEILRRVAA